MWIFEEERGGCMGVCLGVRGLDGFVGSGEPVRMVDGLGGEWGVDWEALIILLGVVGFRVGSWLGVRN